MGVLLRGVDRARLALFSITNELKLMCKTKVKAPCTKMSSDSTEVGGKVGSNNTKFYL